MKVGKQRVAAWVGAAITVEVLRWSLRTALYLRCCVAVWVGPQPDVRASTAPHILVVLGIIVSAWLNSAFIWLFIRPRVEGAASAIVAASKYVVYGSVIIGSPMLLFMARTSQNMPPLMFGAFVFAPSLFAFSDMLMMRGSHGRWNRQR